jgi:AAA15 family ATPase/GTPase
MITRLKLKNFTAFSNLEIDFSPKVNVIIGENGTGKTHLLKAAYGLCAGGSLMRRKPDFAKEDLEAELTQKFLRLFLPLENKIGKLRRTGVADSAQLIAQFASAKKAEVTFHANSKSLTIQGSSDFQAYPSDPVFIPTKEILSFMEGFNSLYEKYEVSFDQTYQELYLFLELPPIRPATLHEKAKWAMAEIEALCGGKFIFYGGGRVTFKTKHTEYSVNAMAEGFRKMGMLARLIQTGAINPGVSGPLFWDEPESNMNPQLMKLLVQILLELARNGQQIILTTHDYVLLKWFDLLMEAGQGDQVRFHSLYRDLESKEMMLTSTDEYLNIAPNPIDEAFGSLINQEIENDMGGLGK